MKHFCTAFDRKESFFAGVVVTTSRGLRLQVVSIMMPHRSKVYISDDFRPFLFYIWLQNRHLWPETRNVLPQNCNTSVQLYNCESVLHKDTGFESTSTNRPRFKESGFPWWSHIQVFYRGRLTQLKSKQQVDITLNSILLLINKLYIDQ